MKKSIISVLSLLLVLALAFTCVGCGGNETSSDVDAGANANDDFFTDTEYVASTDEVTSTDNGGNTTTSSQKTNSTLEENTIKGKGWEAVLKSIPATLKGSTVELVNWNPISEYAGASNALKEFTEQTNIKAKWTVIEYGSYFTKIAARIATDDAPDVCRTKTPNIMGLQNFQPLSAAKYDFSDEAWDQETMKAYSVKGKAYATSLKGTHIASPAMLFYNRTLIKKYDLEDPYELWKSGKWTWDKFLDMGEDFRKASGAEWVITGSNYDPFLPFFGVQGPVEYDGNKYTSIVKTEKYLKIMQTITNLHTGTGFFKHHDQTGFDNGDGLFAIYQSIHARRRNAYYPNLKNAGSLGTVPFPTISGQEYIQNMWEYEAYAIAKGAKNPTAVPYLLRYYLDPANYDMKSFFVDNQALEIHNWCMSQTKRSWPTFNSGFSEYITDDLNMFNTQSSQVKTKIDTNAPYIDTRVKTYNDIIAKFE